MEGLLSINISVFNQLCQGFIKVREKIERFSEPRNLKNWFDPVNFGISDDCPGWKNIAAMAWSCHDHKRIMAKHGHDYAMIPAWRPCFLAWSSWFMTWSWYDCHVFHNPYHDDGMYDHHVFHVFFKKMDCLSIFFQIVAAIYHYMAHLTGFIGHYLSKVTSQQN